MHPVKSIVEYLNSIKFEGLIYILASEEFKNVLRKAGYKLLDGVRYLKKVDINFIFNFINFLFNFSPML